MSFSFLSLRLNRLVPLAVAIAMFIAIPAYGQFENLRVRVGDTTGTSGQQNSVISIYMKSYADTVAGFELWLVLDRPDIMEFQTDTATFYDTTFWRCTTWAGPVCQYWMDVTDSVIAFPELTIDYDSIDVNIYDLIVGNHDTTGTLISGWEFVRSRSSNYTGHDLKIAAYANTIAPPYTHGIPYPQTTNTPLIKIMADIYEIPDDQTDRTVNIFVQATNLDNFSFSDEDGNAIGVITDTILDTTWFHCDVWNATFDTCYYFSEVDNGPDDSFWCCDTILSGRLDSDYVAVYNGSLTVLAGGLCGDANDNGFINILDVTYLIQYLYRGGPPPPKPDMADVNNSGSINILDVTYLIQYLYRGGPAPNCG
ncbi:MAG: dockerin type I repeat-containing protein [Candidatus Zixiibacteriota bacterium]